MFEKILAKLAAMGLPPEYVDMARALEGHALTLATKALVEGEADLKVFIKTEFDKAKAAVNAATAA